MSISMQHLRCDGLIHCPNAEQTLYRAFNHDPFRQDIVYYYPLWAPVLISQSSVIVYTDNHRQLIYRSHTEQTLCPAFYRNHYKFLPCINTITLDSNLNLSVQRYCIRTVT